MDRSCEPGDSEVVWNGLDQSGRRRGAGIYFIQLRGEDYAASRKMLVLR
jgi:hypothetical protein